MNYFIVYGEYSWGRGETLKEAFTNCKKNGKADKYAAFLITGLREDDSVVGLPGVNEVGMMVYPEGATSHKLGIFKNITFPKEK